MKDDPAHSFTRLRANYNCYENIHPDSCPIHSRTQPLISHFFRGLPHDNTNFFGTPHSHHRCDGRSLAVQEPTRGDYFDGDMPDPAKNLLSDSDFIDSRWKVCKDLAITEKTYKRSRPLCRFISIHSRGLAFPLLVHWTLQPYDVWRRPHSHNERPRRHP